MIGFLFEMAIELARDWVDMSKGHYNWLSIARIIMIGYLCYIVTSDP